MNVRQIEIFHAIMKAGTVTEAATRLGLTQPAVTSSLRQLETALGFNLFHRRSGRLHPTSEAHALNVEASQIQDAVFVFSRLAERLKRDLTGHLRIVSPLTFSHSVIPDALVRFLDTEPQCSIDVTTLHHDQILRSFSGPGYQSDLGFTFGGEDKTDIGFRPLAEVDIVALIPAHWPLAARTSISIRELSDLPHVCTFPGEPLGNAVEDLMDDSGVQMRNIVRVHTHILAAQLVSRGVGATLLDAVTATYAASSFGRENLRILPLDGEPSLPVTATYSYQHPLNVHARTFIDIFQSVLNTGVPRYQAV